MDNRESGPSSLFRERSKLKNAILTAITVCAFLHRQAILRYQLRLLQFNLIMTLSAWRYCQISQLKGSVLQDCTTAPLHPYFRHQTQV